MRPSLVPLEAARGRPVTTYAVAVVAVLFVTLLKQRFDWIGRDAPVAVYLGAVMFAAWFGGVGPGLVATALSYACGAYLFAAPYDSLAVESGDEAARLLIASAEGVLISLLAGALRRANVAFHEEARERARSQEALRRANDQVLHAQKMRAVGEFASGVAHDFNNMVSVVLVCVEILERKVSADDPRRPEVDEIRAAMERAGALAQQLLTFGRRSEVQPTSIDVHEVLARSEPILSRVVGPSIRVEQKLAATRTRVLADGAQLEQAVVNLASNGRDAMPDGGTLHIETSDASRGDSPHLELVVRDSGTGMDEATKAHLFEPFFTTKPAGSGTGLGLSMVFGIVDRIGGVITVESVLGQGTTFRLLLPVEEAQ